MADTEVTASPLEGVELRLSELKTPRFTPRDLRLVKESFGRSYTEIMADEESDDRFLVLAWLKLRRDGQDLEIAEMDDVVITLVMDDQSVDPTNGRPATISPPSAATGE